MSGLTTPIRELTRAERWLECAAALIPGLAGRLGAGRYEFTPVAAAPTWNPTAPSTTVDPMRLPRPPTGFRLTLSDVIPSVTARSALAVPTWTPPTAPAAPHAPGVAKGEAALAFSPRVTEPLRPVGTWISVSDELLDDVEQLGSWLNAWLEHLVKLGEEQQLLKGTGTAPEIRGFFSWAGIPESTAVAAASVAETIAAAIAQVVQQSGLIPDLVVMTPTDYGRAAGELILDADGLLLGCVPIASTALAVDQFLVGVSSAAVVGRAGGIVVESTRSHDDQFTKDVSAIRAASLLALGVLQPTAFVKNTT
jgi:Phage capsid family